jgi:hypothetical protein
MDHGRDVSKVRDVLKPKVLVGFPQGCNDVGKSK